MTATSYHFKGRYRSALTALATTGGAIGALIFPILIQARRTYVPGPGPIHTLPLTHHPMSLTHRHSACHAT